MAEQAQQKAQSDSSGEAAAVAAITAVLVAGPPLATAIGAISAAVKINKKAVLAALSLIKYKPGKKTPIPGQSIISAARRRNLMYRAAYILQAARRLADAPDLATGLAQEKRYFQAHLDASKRRMAAARGSQKLVNQTGNTILGWNGVTDSATTPDCLWLIGKNYDATKPPEGLHPGARHAKCRCYPVPAWPGEPVVTALSQSLSGNFPG